MNSASPFSNGSNVNVSLGPYRATLLCRSGCKLPPAGTRVDTQCGTLHVTADAPDGTPLGVVVRASLK